MKLVKAKVENFRSIEDSTEFEIGDMTCLVGKNEAGKTALLQALSILRPYEDGEAGYDKVNDYPRRFLSNFGERHPNGKAVVATTWWELSEEARQRLSAEFGEDAIKGGIFTIESGYGYGETIWDLPIDEAQAIKNVIGRFRPDATEKSPLKKSKTLQNLISALERIETRTEKQEAILTHVKAYRDDNLFKKGIDLIKDLVPSFLYVSHYDRMSGEISAERLISQQNSNDIEKEDKIFLDFLEFSGTTLKELQATHRFEELNAKCEAASSSITDQIFEYWSQNDALEVEVKFSQGLPEDPAPFNSGTVARARVKNTLHRASVPFSERSAGFVWFFSFLVQFAQIRKEAGNVIILLDEPGLTLHGKAQADLLRYIEEKLLPHHQVIFSTHSPFMVPSHRLETVRIVEDVVDRSNRRPVPRGTKVSSDVLVTDKETLFPLQGALGYDITQSLFVGENTLLVEGPSDILYLQAFSDALKRQSRECLDQRWTLCPAGSIDKIQPFVSLFGGNHLNIAVLTDIAQGSKKTLAKLRQSQILQAEHLYTIADFVDKDEADVEDIFEEALFLRIVNKAFDLPAEHELTLESLSETKDTIPRLVKRVEAAFNTMPDTIPTFDHFTPASWLIRNLEILDAGDGEVLSTLGRAEKIFQSFNKLLE